MWLNLLVHDHQCGNITKLNKNNYSFVLIFKFVNYINKCIRISEKTK